MKITRYTSDYFEPITLEITIQTKQELEDLLARVNARSILINTNQADGYKADGESTQELYDVLYDEWVKRGYHTQM